MVKREPKTIVAYWLTPAEPARSFFASTIAELAKRFDAPAFEPHVTIYAGEKGNDIPAQVLSHALTDCMPFPLSARDTQSSDEFTKTIFVQFEPSRALSRLCRALQQASAMQDEYQLNPHLSLIYKKMTPGMKRQIANSLRQPFSEVEFDSVKAVVSPAKIETSDDVKLWRVVATQPLTK